MPRLSASWKRNTYLATNMPRTSGTVVARAPHRKRPMPCVFRPLTKPGPAEMPTMAMKMLRPTEFMNQTVGVGMRPNFGRTERSHPPTIPAMSAPPAVDSVSGAPATLKTSEPINAPTTIAAPTNAMSVTSVGRSATPSILVAAAISSVRPTRVSKSPRLTSVLGRMGISVAVAPRVILRRNTPRAAGHRHGEQFAVLDFDCRCPEDVHQHFALARDRDHVAYLQDDVRGRIHDLAPAPNAQDEEARIGHQRLSLGDAQTGGFATRLHLVGAQRPACPSRARTTQLLLAAPMLFLVVLAGCNEIDAQQLRTDDGDHDRRAHGAEHVGHCVSDRHRVEQGLGLIGGQAQPVDGVGREPHRGRDRLRARVESSRIAEVVAGELCDQHAGAQTEYALHHREDRLRQAAAGNPAHELRPDGVADGEQEHEERERLERLADRNPDLPDHDGGDQSGGHRPEADPLVSELAKVVT